MNLLTPLITAGPSGRFIERSSRRAVRANWAKVLSLLVAGSVLCGTTQAQVPAFRFVDVSSARGIGSHQNEPGMGSGVAAADFDNDGYVDLFIPQARGVANKLYRNVGGVAFVDVATAAGLASTASSRAALWLDYDGDEDLDLLVANDDQTALSSFTLYRQRDDHTFEDVTIAAGLSKAPIIVQPTHHWGGIVAGDVNNDGYVDFFTDQWPGPGHLFINDRDGTFTDATASSGIASEIHFMHQPVMADFNRDGWMDIYVAVDFEPNILWINQRDGSFINMAAETGTANNMNDMGVTLGDYDNDGDLDIYVSNIYMPPPPMNSLGPRYNLLLRNNTEQRAVQFEDVSMHVGVGAADFSWGVTFLDADNDGWLDLAATNGWRSGASVSDPSHFFRNVDGGASPFVDLSDAVQFNDTDWGSSLISFDFDRDGDLDLFQLCNGGPLRLLDNQRVDGAAPYHHLTVKPRMDGPNHFAIGAIVRLTVGSVTMMRMITAGTSYIGQEPAEAVFGMADIAGTNRLIVEWPDGSVSTLDDIALDRIMEVHHGGFGDLNADGEVTVADVGLFAPCMSGPSTLGINYADDCRVADVNADGAVDLADYSVLQNRMTSP